MYDVSVIIPIYNAEQTLKKSIESVINQTLGFSNIELILVDDKSTDNSGQIIRDYANKYDNVKPIFLDENSGLPGKPRNIGIENATSDYVIFLDADDEYLPHAFEQYYDTITHENSDFVMGSHFWSLEGNLFKINILHECEDSSDLININPLKSDNNFRMLSHDHIAPWGKIWRKKLLMDYNIRFPEDALAEDTYFYFKFLINSKKVTLLPNNENYIYYTFENKKTAIHGHDLTKFNRYLKGFKMLMELLDGVNCPKDIIISDNLSNLLLIFSNIDKKYKKDSIVQIYDFEKSLNQEIMIQRKEIDLLNKFILKKRFSIAILLSDIFSFLYNNESIKTLYRKFR